MKYLNNKLWKSAYLIEFKKNGVLKDAFTFSVPPQNEEFNFAQRINETKTFGGSVIDDYGNDSVRISLSGTTINQELKIIYCSSKGNKYLSGQDEIFYLRDLLKKYGNYDNLQGKEVYLYSLDSGKKNHGGKNQKAWRIFVNDFQIKRSKDMPFTYYYTLNCIGIPIEIGVKNKIFQAIGKTYEDLQESFTKFTSYLDKGLEFTSKYLSYIDDFTEVVAVMNNATQEISEYLDSYLGLITGSVESIANAIEETVEFQDTVLSTSLKFTPVYIGTQLYNSTIKLWDACLKMKLWWSDFVNTTEYKKLCSNYNQSEQETNDKFRKVFMSTEKACSEFVAISKKAVSTNSKDAIVMAGNGNENDTIIIVNGYKEYTFTSGDSWATIAQSFYGDSSYAPMLQLYNSDIEIAKLQAGDVVYIPNIESVSNINEANEVYNQPDIKDIYGKDIKITTGGDLAFKGGQIGDFDVIGGISNLNQAILNRLSSSINSRVRNVVYGIRNEVGNASVDAGAIASYITSSIEQTILSDPRVETIEELNWTSDNGQNLNVSVVYKTTTGNTSKYQTVI